MERTDFVTESARQFALIANSPLFLINRLKADSGVQAIAARFSPDEIFETLRDFFITPVIESDNAVDIYVWLVAFAIVSTPTQWGKLAGLSLPDVRWMRDMVAVLASEKRDMYSLASREPRRIRVRSAPGRTWGSASPPSHSNVVKGK